MSEQQFYASDLAGVEQELKFLDEISSGNEIPRLDLKTGDNVIRILPAYSEKGKWFKRYGMHWKLPVEGDRTTFRCPAADDENPQECLFCEAADFYTKNISNDVGKKWRSRTRVDFNVLNMLAPEDGVLLFSAGIGLAKQIFNLTDKYGDPSHPETGYNLTITKKKTGSNAWDVEYFVIADRDPTPLKDWSVLDNLNNLSEIFPPPSLKDQRVVLKLEEGSSSQSEQRLIQPPVEEEVEPTPTSKSGGDADISPQDMLRQRLMEAEAG